MRQYRPRMAVLGLLVLLVSSVAACGSSSSHSANGKGLEKSSIKVATLPLADNAAVYVAQRNGLFKAEGLKVQVVPVLQSTAALPALVKGDVDIIGGGNYVSFLQAQQRGTLKLRILAEASTLMPKEMDVLVPGNSSIRQPKDLEGKTVAVNILSNIQSLTLNAILKADNVDTTHVKYLQIPFPQMGAALQRGQVDAIHAVEPFVSNIQRTAGARIVVDGGSQPVTGMPVAGYIATQQFTQKYPKTAAAFQRAIQKAQALASSDRKQVEQVLPTYARINAQTASVITLPGYPSSLSAIRLQRLIDLMVSSGLLTTRIDAQSIMFTPSA